MTPLEQLAAVIPHMGAKNIGKQLTEWAAQCKTNIVECGSWLGSGTAYLAIGGRKSGALIHVYDAWLVRDSEVKKAAAFGVKLRSGEDSLPLVEKTLEPFGANIAFHQGPIGSALWCGEPIGLFVLDAAKRASQFIAVTETFFPFLEDGATVVLMDYHHYKIGGDKYRDQVRYMAAHPEFELVDDCVGGETSAAVFTYRKNLKS